MEWTNSSRDGGSLELEIKRASRKAKEILRGASLTSSCSPGLPSPIGRGCARAFLKHTPHRVLSLSLSLSLSFARKWKKNFYLASHVRSRLTRSPFKNCYSSRFENRDPTAAIREKIVLKLVRPGRRRCPLAPLKTHGLPRRSATRTSARILLTKWLSFLRCARWKKFRSRYTTTTRLGRPYPVIFSRSATSSRIRSLCDRWREENDLDIVLIGLLFHLTPINLRSVMNNEYHQNNCVAAFGSI